jgi:hypothetical protein
MGAHTGISLLARRLPAAAEGVKRPAAAADRGSREMPISKRDLRRHQRVQYVGPARISWEDGHGVPKYAQARFLEISEGGLRIEVEVFEPIPVRSRDRPSGTRSASPSRNPTASRRKCSAHRSEGSGHTKGTNWTGSAPSFDDPAGTRDWWSGARSDSAAARPRRVSHTGIVSANFSTSFSRNDLLTGSNGVIHVMTRRDAAPKETAQNDYLDFSRKD